MAVVEGAFDALQAITPFQAGGFEGFLFLICFITLVFLVLLIIAGIWVYRDAESRGMEGTLWALGIVIGGLLSVGIIGLVIFVIYLVVRSDHPVGGYYAPYPYGTYPPGAYGPYAPPSAPWGTPSATPPSPPAAAPAPSAGTPVAVTCRQCGSAIPAGGTFCPNCGAPV